MDLAEYLARKKITLEEVLTRADAVVHLVPGDVLFVSGSLVEGLGNQKSDLDLFLLTSRRDIEFTACLNDVATVVGDCLVDIRVVQHGAIDALIARFQHWSKQPRLPRRSFEFVEDERKLLYRLKIGRALYGDEHFGALQDMIVATDLARHKLDWARHLASTIQIDLAGFRSVGDYLSMMFAAQELLGYAIDGLLAGYGYSNSNTKWRVRYLGQLPRNWEVELPGQRAGLSAFERYMSLHRTPARLTHTAIYNQALRIAAFSRIAFPWAERRLMAPDVARLSPWIAPNALRGAGDADVLPHLDLDVEMRYQDGSFEVVRLNESGPSFYLSDEAYSLLCLFDGETPRAAVAARANILNDMMTLVRYARLEADPVIDDDTLQTLLSSRYG